MTVQFRNALSTRILQLLRVEANEPLAFQSIYGALKLKKGENQPEFHLSTKEFASICKDVGVSKSPTDIVSDVLTADYDKEQIVGAKLVTQSYDNVVTFALNQKNFVKEVFASADKNVFKEPKRRIIVEFSSPNIAKPFHFGHLRSTIIGNFISNIYKSFGHDVIRMNYLGDWGTQFGLLRIGMELNKLSTKDIKSDPITHLFNAYVQANQLAASDPSISERARSIFCQLENGQTTDLSDWMECRKFTVDELRRIYQRLGIEFDEYSWESEYRKQNIMQIIDLMNERGLLKSDSDGKSIIEAGGKSHTLLKSDGTTLYLTRDVAAIFDRFEKYDFDEMLYVVENGQHESFPIHI
ncbi:hypothetical protein HA402_002695 [Bradysia odoriphaga]|nr:hypothetical protein HA402_002695 [Bradysia odoriphaga]